MKVRRSFTIVAGMTTLLLLYGVNTEARGEHSSLPTGEMVFIPSGEFLLGSSEKDGKVGMFIGVDEIPQRRVYLKGFYIDRYEVSNRLYKEFIDATGHVPPADELGDKYSWEGNFPPAGQEDLPVTHVSWYDADAYCRWAGKRLPTEEEWEKAARGTDGRQWPWGNDPKENGCNLKYTGPGEILPGGSFPEDLSPYGVYDMCGNVSEWTSSWYLPYPGSTLHRESFGEKYKIVRGGSWVMPPVPYSRLAYRANSYRPDYKHRGIGFRCAKDAE